MPGSHVPFSLRAAPWSRMPAELPTLSLVLGTPAHGNHSWQMVVLGNSSAPWVLALSSEWEVGSEAEVP